MNSAQRGQEGTAYMRARQLFATILAAAAIGVSGMAFAQAARTPAETVDYRHEQFRRVGATFKALNDGMRGSPDMAAIRSNAATLSQLAQDLPNWFPAGTAAPVGDQNRAEAAIWSDASAWNEQVAQFQTATRNLAAARDIAAVRGTIRGVGARCTSCHRAFRTPD